MPLLTLGLPGRVVGWLHDAGLPVTALETSAVRRGIGPGSSDTSIVLFDSRNASARTDADAAESLGYETIDAARLMTGPLSDEDPEHTLVPAASDPRRRFFEGLRPAIEAAGGVWTRISDFPHPFRWSVCDEDDGDASSLDSHREAAFATALGAFADLPSQGSSGRLAAGDWIKSCAVAGRPIRVAGEPAAVLSRHGFKASTAPLAWQTTLVDFAEWWRLRRRFTVRVVRRGRISEVETSLPESLADRLQPALEIWRGRHLAIVPLVHGRMILDDDSLPFQSNASRHFAGFTADAVDLDLSAVRDRTAITAPA
ncbi:MAG: hypothetical protein M3552_09815 [Planctomycetota bacterium]|nr:hypothetical protein [Planctomycetaceae bacterium]MDQ3330934.1 hypothetical protein [Planctomycetota bacterium]